MEINGTSCEGINMWSGTWKLESGSQTLTFSQATGDVIIVPEPAAWAIAAAAWARRQRRG